MFFALAHGDCGITYGRVFLPDPLVLRRVRHGVASLTVEALPSARRVEV